MTEDHSLLNDYVKMKRLSAGEKASFPHKNVIVRALGMKPSVEVDVIVDEPRQGDLYLLCTDGLSGMVPDEEIVELAASETDLDKLCERLVAAANAHGGLDNITVVCARLEPL
jgi:protein phosphatase